MHTAITRQRPNAAATVFRFIERYGALLLLCALLVGPAVAGTDTTFNTIYTKIKGWATGSLGKLLAVSAFLIGMGIGLIKQSAMAIVLGLAFALILFYGPTIMESIVTFAV